MTKPLTALTASMLALVMLAAPAFAANSAAEIEREARAALDRLYADNREARLISGEAHAVLVFPVVSKAGLMIGGQYGEGVLFKRGKVAGHYNTGGASYGLQAGAQQYGYAMFFMNDKALAVLDNADGFEIGVGPSVVVIDKGLASSTTTKTLNEDIYAFIFNQQGLMAGIGLQGNKITKVDSASGWTPGSIVPKKKDVEKYLPW